MKTLSKAVILVTMTLLTIATAQPSQSTRGIPPAGCIKEFAVDNTALRDTLREYLTYIGNYEIPIVAIQQAKDTTHYIISAFIATYDIKKNPPTSIIKINDREALLYTGVSSIVGTAPNCYQYILKKYSQLLRIDKLNRRTKVSPDNHQTYLYDPIRGDIAIAKDGHISTKIAKHFPFIVK